MVIYHDMIPMCVTVVSVLEVISGSRGSVDKAADSGTERSGVRFPLLYTCRRGKLLIPGSPC